MRVSKVEIDESGWFGVGKKYQTANNNNWRLPMGTARVESTFVTINSTVIIQCEGMET